MLSITLITFQSEIWIFELLWFLTDLLTLCRQLAVLNFKEFDDFYTCCR